jgi:hypothetical protein
MPTPTRRVILLGASNVALSFATIVQTVRRMWSAPIEIMAAMGHGRSYGQDSWLLGKNFSGIFPCALWQDLQTREKLPTTALVTDLGNDLLYGATPDQLLEWVERCLDRLAEAGATTLVTQLPADSIGRLGERRFRFFRRLLFPRSTLTLADAKRFVWEINERLIDVAKARKISVIPVSAQWYGFDPIHIKRRLQHEAWRSLLAGWRAAHKFPAIARPSLATSAYLATLTPLEWSQFGFARRTTQPCGRLFDGTTISLY